MEHNQTIILKYKHISIIFLKKKIILRKYILKLFWIKRWEICWPSLDSAFEIHVLYPSAKLNVEKLWNNMSFEIK